MNTDVRVPSVFRLCSKSSCFFAPFVVKKTFLDAIHIEPIQKGVEIVATGIFIKLLLISTGDSVL